MTAAKVQLSEPVNLLISLQKITFSDVKCSYFFKQEHD